MKAYCKMRFRPMPMAYFQALAVWATDKAAQVLDQADREAQAPGQVQAPVLDHVRIRVQTPELAPAQTPELAQAQAPAQDQVQAPAQDPELAPAQVPELAPAQDPAQARVQDQAQDQEQGRAIQAPMLSPPMPT